MRQFCVFSLNSTLPTSIRPPDQHPMAHFRISGGIHLKTSSNLSLSENEPITEYAFQIPPAGTRGRNWWRQWQFLSKSSSFRSNGDGQSAQVCVRSEESNPLHDLPLSRANAPGSLLCRTTKLVTADEDLHPSRRLQVSSSSNAKLGAAVAKNVAVGFC